MPLYLVVLQDSVSRENVHNFGEENFRNFQNFKEKLSEFQMKYWLTQLELVLVYFSMNNQCK